MASIPGNQPGVHPIKSEISPRLPKKLYVGSFAASWLLSTLAGLAVYTFTDDEMLASMGFSFYSQAGVEFVYLFTSVAAALYAVGIVLVMYYRAWAFIQDRYARATPGIAIGLCFIPLFNCYWIFQLIWGFAVDCSAFMSRHRIPGRKPSARLFLACSIIAGPVFFLVLPFAGAPALLLTWLTAPLFVRKNSQVCNAINAIHRVYMERRIRKV